MTTAQIHKLIKKLQYHLQEYVKVGLAIEHGLLLSSLTENEVTALNNHLRERDRDYACMLRMLHLVEKRLLAGEDWFAKYKELREFRKAVADKEKSVNDILDRLIRKIQDEETDSL